MLKDLTNFPNENNLKMLLFAGISIRTAEVTGHWSLLESIMMFSL